MEEQDKKFSWTLLFFITAVSFFVFSALQQQKFFFNEIPDHLPLATDKWIVASVLSGVLAAVASHTADTVFTCPLKLMGMWYWCG